MRHTLWILAVALLVATGCGRSGRGHHVVVAPSTAAPPTTTGGTSQIAPPVVSDPQPPTDQTPLFDQTQDLVPGSTVVSGPNNGGQGSGGDGAGSIQGIVDDGLIVPPAGSDPQLPTDQAFLFDPGQDPIPDTTLISDPQDGGDDSSGDAGGLIPGILGGNLMNPPPTIADGPPAHLLIELGPLVPPTQPSAVVTIDSPAVPEPATIILGLLGVGAAAGELLRRTRPA